jgi:Tfp pilus assembly protein PilX
VLVAVLVVLVVLGFLAVAKTASSGLAYIICM